MILLPNFLYHTRLPITSRDVRGIVKFKPIDNKQPWALFVYYGMPYI